MEAYFGKTAMLYNVHLLLYVTKGVLDFGPLWTHNAFDFEGNNHRLVQMQIEKYVKFQNYVALLFFFFLLCFQCNDVCFRSFT